MGSSLIVDWDGWACSWAVSFDLLVANIGSYIMKFCLKGSYKVQVTSHYSYEVPGALCSTHLLYLEPLPTMLDNMITNTRNV